MHSCMSKCVFALLLLSQGGVNDEVTLSAYITAALLELGIQKTVSKILFMGPKRWTSHRSIKIEIM